MKNVILSIMFSLTALVFASAINDRSQPQGSNESFKLSLYIPGFFIKAGSLFISKHRNLEAKEAMRSMRSVSVVVRNGNAFKQYVASEKYEKKMKKLAQQKFTPLFDVMSSEDNVSIQIKQNKKSKIRQFTLLVNDGEETFIFARVRCNFDMNQLKNFMKGRKEEKLLIISSLPASLESFSGHPQ